MFRKRAEKQQPRELQRRLDRELAEAMFRTARRPAAQRAENALAVQDGDLIVAELPRPAGGAKRGEQFTVDLLDNWCKP